MNDIRATLVIAPRERFSFCERALESIYKHTPEPFKLIYVSGGAPPQAMAYLREQAERRGFELLESDRYLSPNQARNLAIPEIETEYVVFLDNDALVAPGWLGHLIGCADETGASVVGPLYMIGEFERATIHMAGGRLRREEVNGRVVLTDEQYLYDTPISKANMRLRRRECEYVEYHCMLVRKIFLDQVAPLDEELLNLHEERDICMSASELGGAVFIEPKSIVSYVPPPPCEWWDLPYFMLRWSEQWSVASVRRFNEKWRIDAVQHVSDVDRSYEEGTVVGFARAWRSRVAGLTIDQSILKSAAPTLQAQLMVALLASVDREAFSYSLTTPEQPVQRFDRQTTPRVIFHLAELAKTQGHCEISIAPQRQNEDREPTLICVDAMTPEQLANFADLSFMTVTSAEGEHQCWFAVNKSSWEQHSPEASLGEEEVPLAGFGVGQLKPSLAAARVGLLLAESQLRQPGFVQLLNRGRAY